MNQNNENSKPLDDDRWSDFLSRAYDEELPGINQETSEMKSQKSSPKRSDDAESFSEQQLNQKNTSTIPSEKKNRRGWYSVAGMLILVIGFSIGYFRFKQTSTQNISVEGNYYTEASAIIYKAAVPGESSTDSLDLFAVIKRVEELPYIKRADIAVIPPNKIKITVKERQPVALLLSGNSRALVDKEGLILPQLSEKTPDVPLLYGFPVTQVNDTLKSEAFGYVSRFLVSLQEHQLGNSTISEVAWNNKEGILAMSSSNGVKVIFGTENPDESLKNWESFYTQIIPKVGIESLSEVDLRYEGQVIVR